MWDLSQRCKDFSISTNQVTHIKKIMNGGEKQDGRRVEKCEVHVSLQMHQEYITGWSNCHRGLAEHLQKTMNQTRKIPV